MKQVLAKVIQLREHGRVSDDDIVKLLQGKKWIVTSKGSGAIVGKGILRNQKGQVVSYAVSQMTGIMDAPVEDEKAAEDEITEAEDEITESKSPWS